MLAVVVFENSQDVFQAHDGYGLDVAGLTKSGTEERTRQVLLIGRHFANRQALPLFRNEMPVHALIVVEFETGFGPLTGVERGQEPVCSLEYERS